MARLRKKRCSVFTVYIHFVIFSLLATSSIFLSSAFIPYSSVLSTFILQLKAFVLPKKEKGSAFPLRVRMEVTEREVRSELNFTFLSDVIKSDSAA